MRMNCLSPTALLLNFSKFKHPSIFYVNLNKTNVLGGSGGVNSLIPASLSPLAVITFGAYFLHSRRSDSEFAKFTVPALNAIFMAVVRVCLATSRNLLFMFIGCPKHIFFLHTRDLLVGRRTMQRHLFSILHHLFPVILANTTVVPFVLLCNSRFNFHCDTHLLRNRPGIWQLLPLAWKITKDIHLCKPALLNCLIRVSEILFLFLVSCFLWLTEQYPYFCTPQKIFSVNAVTLTNNYRIWN